MAITLSTDDTRREAFLTAEQAKVQIGGGGTTDHRQLTNRDAANQHTVSAITGLQGELDGKLNDEDIAPWAKEEQKPEYDAEEINYDGEIDGYVVENVKSALDVVSEAIDDTSAGIGEINAKIPQQASASNQLADKDFVNSSIENVAAYYITKDAAGNPFATKAELNAATVFYSGGQVRVPTRNDYTVVLHDESKLIGEEAPTTRYLYFNGWNYQYIVNNSGLTADQWKAVNSGATAEIIESVSNKQDKLTAGDGINIDAENVISATGGGSGDSVFVATYGQTTLSEIVAAYNAKKSVICNYGNRQYGLYSATETIAIFNTTDVAGGQIQYRLSVNAQNAWSVANVDFSETLIVTADFNTTDMTISNASHTFAEIAAAYDEKKIVFLRAGSFEFEATAKSKTVVQFTAPSGATTYIATVRNTGVWGVTKTEIVTEITDSAANSQYPSALAVFNYVNSVIGNVSDALSELDSYIGGDAQ